MEFAKAAPGVKKAKKKPVKDDLDRIKQAEKKKRRLEKALATSAAIRSELEKKKLKKKEEQDRLDEESAAIAEAVALHVLIGEDSDDSSNVMRKKHEGVALWDHTNSIGIFMGGRHPRIHCRDLSSYSHEYVAWRSWNLWENPHLMADGNLAAQAVTSLRIADEERVNGVVFNRI